MRGVLAGEGTFAMIKPDGVPVQGAIIHVFAEQGFKVTIGSPVLLSDKAAREFYQVHSQRPFFEELIAYVTSNPSIPLFLRKDGSENIIAEARDVQRRLRQALRAGLVENRIHASDSVNAALEESSIIFEEYARAADNAALSGDVGGIDMNNIDVRRQGSGLDFQFDPAAVDPMLEGQINGFVPVTIRFSPLPSIMPLLGFAPADGRGSGYEISSL